MDYEMHADALIDALDAAEAREKRLREALGKIAAVRWGLPDTATDGEAAKYWAATCHDYRAIARAALRGEEEERE